MKQESKIREFLNLFSYANDDAKKKETINYIISVLSKAEEENKILEFDELNKIEYSPNPLINRKGKVMFNTKTFLTFYNDWIDKTLYVKTEVANLLRESMLILNDMADVPLVEQVVEEEESVEEETETDKKE